MHLTVAVSFSSSTNMDMSLKNISFFFLVLHCRQITTRPRWRSPLDYFPSSDVAARLSSRGGRSVSQWRRSVLKEHRIPQVMDA